MSDKQHEEQNQKWINQKQQSFSEFLFMTGFIYSHEASLTTNKINTFNINVKCQVIVSQWILGVTGVTSAF